MSDYTPGPWEIEGHYHFGYKWISGPEHSQLAQVVWCMEYEDRSPSCEANAHLIAAAPELLEALEYYAEKVADLNRYGVMIETSFRELELDLGSKAEAAIEKARGQDNE